MWHEWRDRRGAYRVLMGRPKGKRPLERPGDHIKTDLQVVGWGGMDWIDLTQDKDRWRALLNGIITFRFP
jgi:hypothetical protein